MKNIKAAFKKAQGRLRGERGSALLAVIILSTGIIIMLAPLLRSGLVEKQLNERFYVYSNARIAAESLIDYAFADLMKRWDEGGAFLSDELSADNHPLVKPAAFDQLFENSQIVAAKSEIIGGNIGSGKWTYIDPEDPSNVNDPQKGKLVIAREVPVYAKAVASQPPFIGEIDAYAKQVFQVRDAPLFAHAVYYNMDLEFHPGPRMDMQGPVHSNENIFVMAVDRLRFHSTVTAAKGIYHGSIDSGSTKQTGTVEILDANSGDWKNMYLGGDRRDNSSYLDNRVDNWRSLANQRWGGNVQSTDHGVPTLKLAGVGEYIPEDYSTYGTERFNGTYALIEPQLAPSDPDFKGTEARKNQFSYKAGLIIRVEEDNSESTGYSVKLYKYDRGGDPSADPLENDDGTLKEIEVVPEEALPEDFVRVSPYAENIWGSVDSGMYDRRQLQGYDLVEIDVDILGQLLDEDRADSQTEVLGDAYSVTEDWNGVVYVELPYDTSASGRDDKIKVANNDIAVRLVNGETIPNPTDAISPGFTLATNGPLFVKGHFNADGHSSTGSSTEPDTSTEPPAALIADAVTILSSAFKDRDSKKHKNYRDAVYTEVSAAIMAGLSPTVVGTSEHSGGAHNFPRFLEDWGGKTFRYRGSLTALYESEVADRSMLLWDHSNWYSPPQRDWGFNELFASGVFPPGTPNVRDYKKLYFRYLTKAEYDAEIAEITN